MSGTKNFLKKLVAEVVVPETGNELIKVLNGKDGLLIKKYIQENVAKIPIARLINYLRTLDLNSWAEGGVDIIVGFLDNIPREQIRELDFSDTVYLGAHSKGEKFHLLLRETKSEAILDDKKSYKLFQVINHSDNEHKQSLVMHFEEAFEKVIANFKDDELKKILKGECFVKEYLPIILSRAEKLFMEPDFPLKEKLEFMEKQYEHFPNCKPAVLLPVARRCHAARAVTDLINLQKLPAFLLSPYFVVGSLKSYVVRKHFLKLLNAENDVYGIEEVFEKRDRPKLSPSALRQIEFRYRKILSKGIEKNKNNLAWLWKRLWRCPFSKALYTFEKPIRKALSKTDPENIWWISQSCRGRKQVELYRKIARRKYIRWFAPRIRSEKEIVSLNNWIGLCKEKTGKKILARVRELWTLFSFNSLNLLYFTPIPLLDNRIGRLRIEMLREKFSEFKELEYSLLELFEAYYTLTPLEGEEWLFFEKAITGEFSKMTLDALASFRLMHRTKYDDFLHQINEAYEIKIQAYINNPSLSPLAFEALAKKLPDSIFATQPLYVEAKKRINSMNIEQIENLFESQCSFVEDMKKRYFELLPTILESSSEKELEQRYLRCPPEFRKEFIEQLKIVAEK